VNYVCLSNEHDAKPTATRWGFKSYTTGNQERKELLSKNLNGYDDDHLLYMKVFPQHFIPELIPQILLDYALYLTLFMTFSPRDF